MLWPPGRVNARDQPSIGALPVLVMVRFSVRPVFQELTAALTRQGPPAELEVLGPGDDGPGDDGPGDEGPGEEGEVGGVEPNWLKNFHTSCLTQLRAPLSQPAHPSTGPCWWPPSNGAQTTGYPARHPE